MIFLENNEILLETNNIELAKEIFHLQHPELKIGEYRTRALEFEPIAKFIIDFSSDAALVFFGHWLATRNAKKSTDKTTINKNEVPHTVEEITALIKKELENIQNKKTDDD